jgi:thiamine-phosphate pyrophosphorylase
VSRSSPNPPSGALVLPRLYAILDFGAIASHGFEPLDILDIWLDAGVRAVQLRAKSLASGEMLALADACAARAHGAGALFIVNDRADIAVMSGADGVHVGQRDLAPVDARHVVGDGRIVGCSTHSDEQAAAACRLPISYLAIGPVYATTTKGAEVDPVVGLDGVRAAAAHAREARLPLVAIGGITIDRCGEAMAAGAASVAVISDLLSADPARRVREYLRALS